MSFPLDVNVTLEHLRDKVLELEVSNVVIGDLPSRQLDCVAVRPVDGYPSVRYFQQTATDEPLIECVVRHKLYQTGQTWYTKIQKALDQYISKEHGINGCLLVGSPGYLGADENGFNEWHMLFHITTFERGD